MRKKRKRITGKCIKASVTSQEGLQNAYKNGFKVYHEDKEVFYLQAIGYLNRGEKLRLVL